MIGPDFLERYHDENAAITEDLLDPARDGTGRDPYQWLVEGLALVVGAPGVVLDLACGSAPVATRLPDDGPGYVGVDLSAAELDEARRRRRDVEVHQVAAADAARVLEGRTVVGVSVAMALMLLDLDAVMGPLRDVTTSGTRLSAIVPTRTPAPGAEDFAGLLRDLGSFAVPFPEPLDAATTGDRLGSLGWRLLALEEQTFARPVRSATDTATIARSFYTCGSGMARAAVADRLRTLQRSARALHYPLRRLVAERV